MRDKERVAKRYDSAATRAKMRSGSISDSISYRNRVPVITS